MTDENGYITEFQEKPSLNEAKSNLINTGIYIFNYKIFDYIPEGTFYDFAKNVFPKLLAEKQINVFDINEYWNDIGTIEQYKQSIQDVFNGILKIECDNIVEINNGNVLYGNSQIPPSTRFIGNTVIGNNCKLGENITLENCVILDNSEIKSGTELSNCIVIPSMETSKPIRAIEEKEIIMV